MAQDSIATHSPPEAPKRPKGTTMPYVLKDAAVLMLHRYPKELALATAHFARSPYLANLRPRALAERKCYCRWLKQQTSDAPS
jgi:hypothetical protein